MIPEPTGRRERLSPGRCRDQLIAAALAVLSTRGYSATTADGIARRVGVSKGLLWHYFDGLDELFEMTARDTLKTLSSAVAAAIDLHASPPDGELRFDQRDLDGLYAAQEAIFRRGQSNGDFRQDLDPRLIAVTYQGAVDSMLSYLDAHAGADEDRQAHTVADILLGGLTPRNDPE